MLDRLCCNPIAQTRKRTPDVKIIASQIIDKAVDEAHIVKNPVAVAPGRLGGLKGR